MNVNEFVRLNANTSQTTSSDVKPDQYNHGYHDGYASGLSFGITFAADRVLDIIDTVNDDLDFGTKEKGVALLIKEKVLVLKENEQ